MLRTKWNAIALITLGALCSCTGTHDPNTLTRKEKAEGFELIFDGHSAEGWRGFQKDAFPEMWVVEEGAFHFNPELEGSRGDIIYDEVLGNFHLKLEWKIAEGGNSGIFYLGDETAPFGAIFFTAPEMQVLDNDKHPDATKGKNGNRKAGSLYDLIPADPQNFKGAGEWNQVEIIHEDGHVKHIQNGEVVVEFQIGSPEWFELVADSKFPGLNRDWARVSRSGIIGLQDHGDHVWYRGIKLKKL
ncbi:MAG: glycosyl hydrolase [Bacteroidetes bacterium]|nr:MAG: glycosyl hydrolase [Bacteroidota bacterium]